MREIKFRAWDGEKIHPDVIRTLSYCLIAEDITVEQYTGLKDFNNVEIYEGDILKDVDDSTIVGFVEYDEAFGEYDCGNNNLYECTRDCIVIGNIHDNADLLEE